MRLLNILIVEDDEALLNLYGIVLRKEGYETFPAHNGEETWQILEKEHIDLVITDVLMPVMDGYEFVRSIREYDSAIPILMITAKDDFASKNRGFSLGTDDYMTKPVDVGEMVLRVKALLRRANIAAERKLTIHDTRLDWDSMTASCHDQSCMLPPKEFYLLYRLLSYPGKIFTRKQLMEEIWGMESQFFLTGILVFAGVRLKLISSADPVFWLPLAGVMAAAALFSFSFTLAASRYFFLPVRNLIVSLNQVAAGNFQVRLSEDVTWSDIREMNINFNRMVRELDSIELLKLDFIQNVSHEIKTPLAAIEGYATLLSSSSHLKEQQEYSSRILESSRQLTALTENILKLSKLENQQIAPEKHRFSLDEQLRRCILSMEPLWSEKNICLDIDLPEIFYYGNEDLLVQVWGNLFSNAVKFTSENGTIAVWLAEHDESVQIVFSDTGIGMSKEVKRHIFDKFYQGDASRSSCGSGLGLALVKRILILCGGRIEVDSHPGEGSCFTVWLPK